MLQSYRKYIPYIYIVTRKQHESLRQNALAQLCLNHIIQSLKKTIQDEETFTY